jgi:hypothetical protein
MAFEAATSTGPTTLHVDIMPDAIALLPKGGQDRLRKLRLRSNDLNKLIPKFEDTHAATMARVEAEQRLARLREHPSRGGFGLADTDERVVAAAQRLKEVSADEGRITALWCPPFSLSGPF